MANDSIGMFTLCSMNFAFSMAIKAYRYSIYRTFASIQCLILNRFIFSIVIHKYITCNYISGTFINDDIMLVNPSALMRNLYSDGIKFLSFIMWRNEFKWMPTAELSFADEDATVF